MKEATGELNMTVVTVVAIAAVAAFFYAFVWPSIQASIKKNTCEAQCPAGESSQCMIDCLNEGDKDAASTTNPGYKFIIK